MWACGYGGRGRGVGVWACGSRLERVWACGCGVGIVWAVRMRGGVRMRVGLCSGWVAWAWVGVWAAVAGWCWLGWGCHAGDL